MHKVNLVSYNMEITTFQFHRSVGVGPDGVTKEEPKPKPKKANQSMTLTPPVVSYRIGKISNGPKRGSKPSTATVA